MKGQVVDLLKERFVNRCGHFLRKSKIPNFNWNYRINLS